MNIEGRTIRLRAVEPGDVDLMYEWENDCDIWPVSGTTEPFSRHQLERFVERHQDIVGVLCDGQLRLIIETLLSSKPVGAIDLFEYDPIHRRAGIGILIYEQSDRGRGYASDAVETLCRYAHDTLRTRYAARASAVVQRRCRQRSEPAPVPQRGIHRDRRQTRLAMAARRLSRRGDAAKDAGVIPFRTEKPFRHRNSQISIHIQYVTDKYSPEFVAPFSVLKFGLQHKNKETNTLTLDILTNRVY